MSTWEYMETHDGTRDDKIKGVNAWPMFKNKKTGLTTYQYFGELPPDVYREFDANGDPIYKNAAGATVHLVGERYKEPVTYTRLPSPYPADWSVRASGSQVGYTTYFKKGGDKGQFAAPGVLPEGLRMRFNAKGVIFYQGPPPKNQEYHDADLKGPPGWRHPKVATQAAPSATAMRPLVSGVNPLPLLPSLPAASIVSGALSSPPANPVQRATADQAAQQAAQEAALMRLAAQQAAQRTQAQQAAEQAAREAAAAALASAQAIRVVEDAKKRNANAAARRAANALAQQAAANAAAAADRARAEQVRLQGIQQLQQQQQMAARLAAAKRSVTRQDLGGGGSTALVTVPSPAPAQTFRGLANPGGATYNRCYMNAALQLLLSIPEMRSSFSSLTIDQISRMILRTGAGYVDCDASKLQKIKALKLLFDKETRQGPAIDTNALVLQAGSSDTLYESLLSISSDPDEFPRGRQSDSNAMLGYILDTFSCFDHPLINTLINSLKLQEKNQIGSTKSSLRPPRVTTLINVINLKGVEGGIQRTQTLLDTNQEIEELDASDMYYNTKEEGGKEVRNLSKPVPFKKLTYMPLPTTESLIIQLPRFGDMLTRPPLKKLDTVIIPDPLINLNGVQFELKGSILHLGATRNSGHYVYMVFENGQPQFVMNDSSRDPIGESYLTGHSTLFRNSYVLLYRRVTNLTPNSQAVYAAASGTMLEQARKIEGIVNPSQPTPISLAAGTSALDAAAPVSPGTLAAIQQLEASGQAASSLSSTVPIAGTSTAAPGSEPATIIMRHGRRIDDLMMSPRDPNYPIYEAWADAEKAKGRQARFYDPPLVEYDCVQQTADTFNQNFTKITKIITSPFLRCIQTAAGIAAKCGVTEIVINNNLGEEYTVLATFMSTKVDFSLLSLPDQVSAAKSAYAENGGKGTLNISVSVLGDKQWDSAFITDPTRQIGDFEFRIGSAIERERADFKSGANSLLFVTHGGFTTVLQGDKAPRSPFSKGFFSADYCGFYFYDSNDVLRAGTNIDGKNSRTPAIFKEEILTGIDKYKAEAENDRVAAEEAREASRLAALKARDEAARASAAGPQKECPACTFSNPATNTHCEMCGTDLSNVAATPGTGGSRRTSAKRKKARKTHKSRKSRHYTHQRS